jgi:hypothetical protein
MCLANFAFDEKGAEMIVNPFVTLDFRSFSFNDFVGSIPSSIGNLQNLVFLYGHIFPVYMKRFHSERV